MRKNVMRCECCGRFASGLYSELYTLYGIKHEHAEDVAVCQKCSDAFEKDPDSAIRWLDARFVSMPQSADER